MTPTATRIIKSADRTIYLADRVIVEAITYGEVTKWTRNGIRHRDGGMPAVIKKNKQGVIICEKYYYRGQLHRDDDLPAVIERTPSGVITQECYYKYGRLYRNNNLPVRVGRVGSGCCTYEQYSTNTQACSKKQCSIMYTHAKNKIARLERELDKKTKELNDLKKMISESWGIFFIVVPELAILYKKSMAS